MRQSQAVFLGISIALHCVAAITVGLLFYATRGMTGFCVIPAALVACASVPAVPRRPINLYASFGLLVGFSFWAFVSALNQREWLGLLLPILLVAGAVWLLQAPGWPSLGFSGVIVALCLIMAAPMFSKRPDFDDPIPDRARKSAVTAFGILFLASAYSGAGFAEALFKTPGGPVRPRRKKKRRRRHDEDEED